MKNSTLRHTIKNTTRGGQVFLHNLRMIEQVLGKVFLWTLPLALLSGVAWFFMTTNANQRYIGQQWLVAQIHLFFNESHASGNKNCLLGISKRGDSYLRQLLIHGGRAVVRTSAEKTEGITAIS